MEELPVVVAVKCALFRGPGVLPLPQFPGVQCAAIFGAHTSEYMCRRFCVLGRQSHSWHELTAGYRSACSAGVLVAYSCNWDGRPLCGAPWLQSDTLHFEHLLWVMGGRHMLWHVNYDVVVQI
jgi:hypothetical protein